MGWNVKNDRMSGNDDKSEMSGKDEHDGGEKSVHGGGEKSVLGHDGPWKAARERKREVGFATGKRT